MFIHWRYFFPLCNSKIINRVIILCGYPIVVWITQMNHLTGFGLQKYVAFFVLFFYGAGVWTQGLHCEPPHQPFFVCDGVFFEIGSCVLFAQAGFQPLSSWVSRITGVSHWCPHPTFLFIFFFFLAVLGFELGLTLARQVLCCLNYSSRLHLSIFDSICCFILWSIYVWTQTGQCGQSPLLVCFIKCFIIIDVAKSFVLFILYVSLISDIPWHDP
jgi:hypothetical protein